MAAACWTAPPDLGCRLVWVQVATQLCVDGCILPGDPLHDCYLCLVSVPVPWRAAVTCTAPSVPVRQASWSMKLSEASVHGEGRQAWWGKPCRHLYYGAADPARPEKAGRSGPAWAEVALRLGTGKRFTVHHGLPLAPRLGPRGQAHLTEEQTGWGLLRHWHHPHRTPEALHPTSPSEWECPRGPRCLLSA